MIPFSEIARDYDVEVQTLYNIKNRMRKNGELNDDII